MFLLFMRHIPPIKTLAALVLVSMLPHDIRTFFPLHLVRFHAASKKEGFVFGLAAEER